ncbi:DUF4145 domain-containing protein [Carnobacterium divergens]|uniref:DUF4145 domain-containing protein n=1 Tax=Carnobacterium divergens TaxID=2748 RepID=UPI0039C99262
MSLDVSIKFHNGSDSVNINLPNHCPHCGTIMTPNVHFGVSLDSYYDDNSIVAVMVNCTNDSCKKFYSLSYNYYKLTGRTKIIDEQYRPPIKVELPENIEKVSKTFVEIYSQATIAESEKLDQIAGVGYRKALEFLIKDYAIRNNTDDEEKIKKKMLGAVISEFLGDFRKLQNLAKAATWIGNDETHYERKHTDKDIRDMKAFIRSASQFIAADYDADIAEDFINPVES